MNKTILAMLLTACTTSAWWAAALWGNSENGLISLAVLLSLGLGGWIGNETYETIKRG